MSLSYHDMKCLTTFPEIFKQRKGQHIKYKYARDYHFNCPKIGEAFLET